MLGLIYDERCLAHDNGSMLLEPRAARWLAVGHAEGPERIARSWELLERSARRDGVEPLAARAASPEEIGVVHPASHLERLRAGCERGEVVWVGPEARVGPRSWEPILLAAGAAALAVERALAGKRRTFALIRPPGHHASAEESMGFCLLNNAAIAARLAFRDERIGRVAIVDWDVHHGNGTETIFAADPDVLFVSLHQDDLYPRGRGAADHVGEGAGRGATVNVPLPAGSGDDAYLLALDRVVGPALRRHRPDLVVVSAGQDAGAADPLGRMSVTAEGFRSLAAGVAALADELCEGRLVVLHEGGYSPDHVPFCNLAIIEALAGLEPTFETDPLEMDTPEGAGAAAEAAVAEVARIHGL